MMEYILVMVVIVVIVFVAFKQGGKGVIETTQDKTVEYFDTGANAIMGGYFDGTGIVSFNPKPINGKWCAWSTCISGFQSRECACPRPAFGGKACANTGGFMGIGGDGAIRKGACPGSGEQCWNEMELTGEEKLLFECGPDADTDCRCSAHSQEPWDKCPAGYRDGDTFYKNNQSCFEWVALGTIKDWRKKGQKKCLQEKEVSHCIGDACTTTFGRNGHFDRKGHCKAD